MSRDTLFLIEPGFEDPKHPGVRFFCPYCNQVEGVLASNPTLAETVDVVRVPFPRPRAAVIDRLGEANQGLPVLILGDDRPLPVETARYGNVHFVADTKRILALLADRHGVPYPHG